MCVVEAVESVYLCVVEVVESDVELSEKRAAGWSTVVKHLPTTQVHP